MIFEFNSSIKLVQVATGSFYFQIPFQQIKLIRIQYNFIDKGELRF